MDLLPKMERIEPSFSPLYGAVGLELQDEGSYHENLALIETKWNPNPRTLCLLRLLQFKVTTIAHGLHGEYILSLTMYYSASKG